MHIRDNQVIPNGTFCYFLGSDEEHVLIDQGGEPDYQFLVVFRRVVKTTGYFGTYCDNVDFELQTVRSGKFM